MKLLKIYKNIINAYNNKLKKPAINQFNSLRHPETSCLVQSIDNYKRKTMN